VFFTPRRTIKQPTCDAHRGVIELRLAKKGARKGRGASFVSRIAVKPSVAAPSETFRAFARGASDDSALRASPFAAAQGRLSGVLRRCAS
jgi:hypothetical protein